LSVPQALRAERNRQQLDGRPVVAVIGAGITGLVAARQLAAGGVRVVVLEGRDRVGGQLQEATVAGHRVDVGAESVFTAAPGPLELVEELGLSDDLVGARRATTWIWTRRGLRALPEGFTPAGPSRLGPVRRSRVLSPAGMLRAGLEPLVPSGRGDGDVSVGAYLERRFGREVVDRLVDPLLGGLHAGDVRTLSLQAATPQLAALAAEHRSLLLRRRPSPATGPMFVTLTSGMDALTTRLAAAAPGVELRLGTEVTQVERVGGVVQLSLTGVGPSPSTGPWWRRRPTWRPASSPQAARRPRTNCGSCEPHRSWSPPWRTRPGRRRARDRVGHRHPRAEHQPPAAEGRHVPVHQVAAPAARRRHVLIRASAGRAGDDRAIQLDDDRLVAQLHRELAAATGLAVAPIDATVYRWPETMPQLEVGTATGSAPSARHCRATCRGWSSPVPPTTARVCRPACGPPPQAVTSPATTLEERHA
jgi:protoporphyrinogen/coproporphyrinogen III oxidase